MYRLTQKDDQGNWCLKGLPWEQLYVGQVITQEVSEKLYGALWKLMEYEDTGLSPEAVEDLLEEQSRHQWIPVAERLPDLWQKVIAQDHYGNIMTVSCLVNGSGATCFGEPDEWYATVNDFISWMPLPEPYRPED